MSKERVIKNYFSRVLQISLLLLA